MSSQKMRELPLEKVHTIGLCIIKISYRKLKIFLGILLWTEDHREFSDFIECSKGKEIVKH